MNKKNQLILIFSLISLTVFGSVIIRYEKLRKSDRTVYLKLAPRDPRSIMQGDYMTLRYNITRERRSQRANELSPPSLGYIVCISDSGTATAMRIQKKKKPLNKGEFLIRYRMIQGDISIGSEEFFFQEGRGKAFAQARFAKVSISDKGKISLLGLYDRQKSEIK